MKLRALTLGALVGFLFAVVPSCGKPTCGPANCKGCCAADNKCVEPAANTTAACGTSGIACKACVGTETCVSGQCTGGGGGGGGSDAGTVVGCGPGTDKPCLTGCCAGTGTSAFCMLGNSAANCGTGGGACAHCSGASTCTAQSCTDGGSGGVSPGTLGAPCNADSDCALTGGNPNFCKKSNDFGSLPFNKGYCTRYCNKKADCPNGDCAYFLGPLGEELSYCYLSCTGTVCPRAADGYQCIDISETATPSPVCFASNPDGGNLELVDAGPNGNPGVTGSPCTTAVECQPPGSGFCAAQFVDGGGGACTSDCSVGGTDIYCGDGGTCIGFNGSLPGQDTTVFWLCKESCNPADAVTTCRPGHRCRPLSFDVTKGICGMRCDTVGAPPCASGSTCDVDGGACI